MYVGDAFNFYTNDIVLVFSPSHRDHPGPAISVSNAEAEAIVWQYL